MIIKGERVTLRPLSIKDAPRFVKWMKNKELNKYLLGRSVTPKEELEWLRSIPKTKDARFFAIDVKKEHIGMISLRDINLKDSNAYITIMIGDPKFWGKGFGYEATKLMLDLAFKKLKLHRVALHVYEFNVRAIALYKKLGFKIEGRMRDSVKYQGKFYQEFVMGLLKNEYK